jgi:hypothetical protein
MGRSCGVARCCESFADGTRVAGDLGAEVVERFEADLITDAGDEVEGDAPVVFGQAGDGVGFGVGLCIDEVCFDAEGCAVDGRAGADVDGGVCCRAVGECGDAGVDALGGWHGFGVDVGCGEADGSAEPVALCDQAFDAVRSAQDVCGVADSAVGEEPAGEGAGCLWRCVVVERCGDGVDGVNGEAEVVAEGCEDAEVAGAFAAEAEIVAFDDVVGFEWDEPGLDECCGVEREEGFGGFEAVDVVGTGLAEEAFASGPGGEPWWRALAEDGCWVWIEGEGVDGSGGSGELSGLGDEVLVGEVDAVEVAYGDGGGHG